MRETGNIRTNAMEIDLQELLVVFLRKWLVIVVCLAVGAAAAFGVTWKFVTPIYRAEITIYVNNSRGTETMEYLSNADIAAAQRLVNTYMSITKSDRVLEKVSQELDGAYSAGQLKRIISTEQLNETEIFCVRVSHPDPVEAARVANAVAAKAPGEISDLIEGTSARVIDTAKIPSGRYSPSYSRMAIVGAVVGTLLALVFLSVQYLRDTRIKDENDLTSLFEHPILGRIPNFENNTTSSYGYSSEEEKKEEEETET